VSFSSGADRGRTRLPSRARQEKNYPEFSAGASASQGKNRAKRLKSPIPLARKKGRGATLLNKKGKKIFLARPETSAGHRRKKRLPCISRVASWIYEKGKKKDRRAREKGPAAGREQSQGRGRRKKK